MIPYEINTYADVNNDETVSAYAKLPHQTYRKMLVPNGLTCIVKHNT